VASVKIICRLGFPDGVLTYREVNGIADWAWVADQYGFAAEEMGEVLGEGRQGIVFRLYDGKRRTNKVVKIVPLHFVEDSIMGPGSIPQLNIYQAELFKQLALAFGGEDKDLTEDDIPHAIPYVYEYGELEVDEHFIESLTESALKYGWSIDETDFLSEWLTPEMPCAYWIMEYVPCLGRSRPSFCDFAPPFDERETMTKKDLARIKKEQIGYEQMATFLFDKLGWVMKDVVSPSNFGYRRDGSVVYFDPMVLPWPITSENEEEWNEASLGDAEVDKWEDYVESGDYFQNRTQWTAYWADNSHRRA